MRHEVVYKLNMNTFGKNFHSKQLTAFITCSMGIKPMTLDLLSHKNTSINMEYVNMKWNLPPFLLI